MKLSIPKISITAWYIIAGVLTVVSYPYIMRLLSEQFSVYQIHMGNEASYVAIFAITGWLVQKFSVKKWGKFDYRGFIALTVVLVILTLILWKFFGYKFFN
jgi:hypothetical protein